MARMLSLHKEVYVPFAHWITNELPLVPDNETVWRAFLDHGQFRSDEEARAPLGADTFPWIYVEKMGWLGKFDPQKPNTISISNNIVEDYCRNSGDEDKRQTVEATVLHEMVHWSWKNVGKKEPPDQEMGKAFELAAYPERMAVVVEASATTGSGLRDETLGELSRRWESRGDPGATGRDTNGGWSYGLYQLSSKQGSVGQFLTYLARQGTVRPGFDVFAARLQNAGGEPAAMAGTEGFKMVWKELALDPEFSTAQHYFIKTGHYDKYATNLMKIGIDIKRRSHALRDVAWSVSVQHGPGKVAIFKNAWDALDATARHDDERFINGIYDERSRVDVYFRSSNPNERAAVLRRFVAERQAALELLLSEST